PIGAKKVTVDELVFIKSQSPNLTWVWGNGCWDLIHAGHLKTFEEARKWGDKVVIGINTDESVKMLKGDTRPILPYNHRAELIANLQYVDFVVPIEEKTPQNIIEKIKPHHIVKGQDYKIEDIAGWEVV